MSEPLSFLDLPSQDRKAKNGEPDRIPRISCFQLRENKCLVGYLGIYVFLFGSRLPLIHAMTILYEQVRLIVSACFGEKGKGLGDHGGLRDEYGKCAVMSIYLVTYLWA